MKRWCALLDELNQAGWWYSWSEDAANDTTTLTIQNENRVRLRRRASHAELVGAVNPESVWLSLIEYALGLGSAIEAGLAHLSKPQPYGRVVAYDEVADFTEEQLRRVQKYRALGEWAAKMRCVSTYPEVEVEPTPAQKYWQSVVVQGTAQSIQTDRECARRMAEQLSAGGVDCDYTREAIRRRVETELAMLERVQQDMKSVHGSTWSWPDGAGLGHFFRMTKGDLL